MKCFIVSLCIFITCLSPSVLTAESAETINNIDAIIANEYDKESYKEKSHIQWGTVHQGVIRYASNFDSLYVLKKRGSKGYYLTVVWGNLEKNLDIKGRVSYIRWRPNHTGFMYMVFHEGSPGDFGSCETHYVELVKEDDTIRIDDTTICADQMNTDLGWSNDGKYYAFSEASSFRIRNFATGVTWAAKEIHLITDNGDLKIKEKQPFAFSGFIWVNGDKEILFSWREHPFNDDVRGYAVLNTDQFKLE